MSSGECHTSRYTTAVELEVLNAMTPDLERNRSGTEYSISYSSAELSQYIIVQKRIIQYMLETHSTSLRSQ